MKLNDIRKRIDGIDNQIMVLLVRRLKLADQIIKIKDESGMAIVDKTREKQILDNIKETSLRFKLNTNFVIDLYKMIIKETTRRQSLTSRTSQ